MKQISSTPHLLQYFFLFTLVCFCSQTFAKKNVLFIISDDMNDWIEPYKGHPQVKTPNLARFAEKAVVFKNAYCASPLCCPSRTAMLTGLRPTTSGIWGNEDDFRASANPAVKNVVTLPQYLKSRGFYTTKSAKIFHLSFGEDVVSWTDYVELGGARFPPGDATTDHGMVLSGSLQKDFRWGVCLDESFETTGDFQAAYYIAGKFRTNKTMPFFMAYGPKKPHLPWFVPKKFFDLYDTSKLTVPEIYENDLDDSYYKYSNKVQAEVVRTKNFKNAVQAYLANLSFVDACVGALLDSLDKHPFKDSTIVLMMGDHGWHLSEKEHWGKSTLWEEATKTPLIIYDPTIAKSGVCTHPVSLQDLYPTLCDLTGEAKPAHVAGRSFRPLLENPQSTSFIGWALISYHTGAGFALRTNKWYLIRYNKAGTIVYDLYDMQKDPLQHDNLAKLPEHSILIARLSEDIDEIIAGRSPKNTNLYGDQVSINLKDRRLNTTLFETRTYDLKVYSLKGQLAGTFKGRGISVIQMLQNPNTLGLPAGNYVYSVYDRNQKRMDKGTFSTFSMNNR